MTASGFVADLPYAYESAIVRFAEFVQNSPRDCRGPRQDKVDVGSRLALGKSDLHAGLRIAVVAAARHVRQFRAAQHELPSLQLVEYETSVVVGLRRSRRPQPIARR